MIKDKPYLPFESHGDGATAVTADSQTLMRQGPMTADEYLLSAIDHIDRRLGKGYAKAHPELIGAFMQAAMIDLGTAIIARAIESIDIAAVTRERS